MGEMRNCQEKKDHKQKWWDYQQTQSLKEERTKEATNS